MRFAKSTGCFYPYDVEYKSLPADIIAVPQSDFDAAMARSPGDTLDVIGGRVVVVPKPAPTLADEQAAKLAGLSSACRAQILSGFSSSALGAAHAYPAKETDQANLSASVLASLLLGNAAEWTTPFWCQDETGAWAFVPHTAAQIQQVGLDAKAAILAAMSKSETLAAQVRAATTIAAVKAIVW